MSYEGYVQCLCANGHYEEEPEPYGMDLLNDIGTCDICGSPRVWANSVDQTNGPDVGFINMVPFKISDEKTEKCNLGHIHVVEEPRFRVPTAEETQLARAESIKKLQESGIEY